MIQRMCRLAVVLVSAVVACDGAGGSAGSDASSGSELSTDSSGTVDAAHTQDASGEGDLGGDSSGAQDAPALADGADTSPGGAFTPEEVAGCDGAKLLSLPPYAERGPWDVGARTLTIAGLVTEVWYPAPPGSAAGKEPWVYDLRDALPETEREKIPHDHAPVLPCECVRDLPLDTAHGPYPVVVFVHGTAAFRMQSLSQMTHWASRGFVVVASDHPLLKLADVLAGQFGADLPGDVGKVLDALAAQSGDLTFLAGRLALDRIGLAGHSAGGGGIKTLSSRPGVRAILPMAAGGVEPGDVATVVFGGLEDGIVPFSQQQKGYDQSAAPKRLVGLAKAGHLAFSDICAIAREEGGLLELALAYGVTVPQPELFAVLATDGCKPGQLTPEEARPALNDATAAALEEALRCDAAAAAALSTLRDRHASVEVYSEEFGGP